MNELVKTLAARSKMDRELWPDIAREHVWIATDEELEEFAQMIVKECASLAKSKSEYIQSMETDDRGDQMQIQSLAWQFEEFGYKIKKHFGIDQ